MTHVITYCEDMPALRIWMAENIDNYIRLAPSLDDENSISVLADIFQLTYSEDGMQSLAMCMVETEDVQQLIDDSPLIVLGSGIIGSENCPYEQIKADSDKLAMYYSVYNYPEMIADLEPDEAPVCFELAIFA